MYPGKVCRFKIRQIEEAKPYEDPCIKWDIRSNTEDIETDESAVEEIEEQLDPRKKSILRSDVKMTNKSVRFEPVTREEEMFETDEEEKMQRFSKYNKCLPQRQHMRRQTLRKYHPIYEDRSRPVKTKKYIYVLCKPEVVHKRVQDVGFVRNTCENEYPHVCAFQTRTQVPETVETRVYRTKHSYPELESVGAFQGYSRDKKSYMDWEQVRKSHQSTKTPFVFGGSGGEGDLVKHEDQTSYVNLPSSRHKVYCDADYDTSSVRDAVEPKLRSKRTNYIEMKDNYKKIINPDNSNVDSFSNSRRRKYENSTGKNMKASSQYQQREIYSYEENPRQRFYSQVEEEHYPPSKSECLAKSCCPVHVEENKNKKMFSEYKRRIQEKESLVAENFFDKIKNEIDDNEQVQNETYGNEEEESLNKKYPNFNEIPLHKLSPKVSKLFREKETESQPQIEEAVEKEGERMKDNETVSRNESRKDVEGNGSENDNMGQDEKKEERSEENENKGIEMKTEMSKRIEEDARKVSELMKLQVQVEFGKQEQKSEDSVKKQFEDLATTGAAITEQQSRNLMSLLTKDDKQGEKSRRPDKIDVDSLTSSIDDVTRQENTGVSTPEYNYKKLGVRRSKTFCGKLNKSSSAGNRQEHEKKLERDRSETFTSRKREQSRKKSKHVSRKEILQEAMPSLKLLQEVQDLQNMKELIYKLIDNEMIKTAKSTSSLEVSTKMKQNRRTRNRSSDESLVKLDASRVIEMITDSKSKPSSEVKITLAKEVTDELVNRNCDRLKNYKQKILKMPCGNFSSERGDSCDSVDYTRCTDSEEEECVYIQYMKRARDEHMRNIIKETSKLAELQTHLDKLNSSSKLAK